MLKGNDGDDRKGSKVRTTNLILQNKNKMRWERRMISGIILEALCLMRSVHILCARTAALSRSKKHNMVAELCLLHTCDHGICWSMCALLERIRGIERALLEQHVRADQAKTALQALQHQQQQSATTAQQAQRRVAAAPAVVEMSWRPFKFQFVAHCGAIDSRLKDMLGVRDQGRRGDAQHPHGAHRPEDGRVCHEIRYQR